MISLVYYFHTSRTDNLRQVLRILSKREKINDIVLVCNDYSEEKFEGCRLYNMNLDTYNKPKMCNFGVSMASNKIVALLDSDRILPPKYFETIAGLISPKQFISCSTIYNIKKSYADDKIEQGYFDYWAEKRSKGWEIRTKNLFSGNTVFFKEDYIIAGGMDDSFEGYGFADNDMTFNVLKKGFNAVWRPEIELHLYHDKKIMVNREIIEFEEYRKISESNMCKFLRKWKMKERWQYCGCLLD